MRTIRLQMKRGLAIVKELKELPLKNDVLLHTHEYIFCCNPPTFEKVVGYHSLKDKEEANRKLEEFFLHEVIAAPNLVQFCFDADQVARDTNTKSNLILP